GFSEKVVVSLSASALTSYRFTLNHRGAMLGWEMSPDQLGDRRPAVNGLVKNLYFVGHWTQPGGGITPVIVSAMRVAKAITEHARFFDTGKSVNSFLGDYKRGVEEALKKKDISEIMRFYSDRYNSPARGRWVTRPAPDESDVSVLNVVAEGREDYDKAALAEEVAGYLSTIASV